MAEAKQQYELVVNPAAVAKGSKKPVYRLPGEGLLGGRAEEIDPIAELQKLTETYRATPRRHTTMLIRGAKGIGKTTLAESMIKPVLLHSFDPGGPDSLNPELLNSGAIMADRRFEANDYADPVAFSLWETAFMSLKKAETFEKIGTYFLDSLTGWISITKDRIQFDPPEGGMSTGYSLTKLGWGMVSNVLQIMIRMVNTLPCHVVLTAHEDRFTDEISQTSNLGIAAPPSLQVTVPALFSEYYVMLLDPRAQGTATIPGQRVLQTQSTIGTPCGTRIGRGNKFDLYEPPNIKALLQKAGYKTEDLPLFYKPQTT